MIDQAGGRLDHAPGTAAGTKPTSLAAEGDQVFMQAAVALDAQEPVLQQPAFQVILELLADKAGKVTAGTFNLLQEAGVMFRNDRIECGLFRPMPLIGGRGSKWGRSRHRT